MPDYMREPTEAEARIERAFEADWEAFMADMNVIDHEPSTFYAWCQERDEDRELAHADDEYDRRMDARFE